MLLCMQKLHGRESWRSSEGYFRKLERTNKAKKAYLIHVRAYQLPAKTELQKHYVWQRQMIKCYA